MSRIGKTSNAHRTFPGIIEVAALHAPVFIPGSTALGETCQFRPQVEQVIYTLWHRGNDATQLVHLCGVPRDSHLRSYVRPFIIEVASGQLTVMECDMFKPSNKSTYVLAPDDQFEFETTKCYAVIDVRPSATLWVHFTNQQPKGSRVRYDPDRDEITAYPSCAHDQDYIAAFLQLNPRLSVANGGFGEFPPEF